MKKVSRMHGRHRKRLKADKHHLTLVEQKMKTTSKSHLKEEINHMQAWGRARQAAVP